MTSTCAPSPPVLLAASQAAINLEENRAAISRSQPQLSVPDAPTNVEWVFARDRALTARDLKGQWLTGCSLPRRAAAEMMRKLEVTGPVACFLAPTHAAQLRVALDKLRPEQAVIALVPETSDLAFLLSCDHFVREIEQHRLWLIAGESWEKALEDLFADHPGLCTPMQFIRLPIAEQTIVDPLIESGQRIFGAVNGKRGEEVRRLRDSYVRRSRRFCVAADTRFRLWDDAGALLHELLADADAGHVNLDDPTTSSPMALARAAAESGVLVAANTARADLPGILSSALPWITWASGTRIPDFSAAAPNDALITAYPQLAQRAGWPANRILEATWPKRAPSGPGPSRTASENALAIAIDTHPLDPPADLSEYSSHRVLWEQITADLHDDPFALTDDVDAFLTRRMRKLDIAAENFPAQRFVVELILPAYQQSLARFLIRAKIPVAIFGKGWDQLPDFATFARGIVESRQNLREIASGHRGLVHVWPQTGPHAMDSLGVPTLRRRGGNGTSLVNDARSILTGRAVSSASSAPSLCAEMIFKLAR